jgi:hypothetical protein
MAWERDRITTSRLYVWEGLGLGVEEVSLWSGRDPNYNLEVVFMAPWFGETPDYNLEVIYRDRAFRRTT